MFFAACNDHRIRLRPGVGSKVWRHQCRREEEAVKYINFLELSAAFLAIKIFVTNP